MSQPESDPERVLRFDATIEELELILHERPGDQNAARQLITILNHYQPSKHGLGTYTDGQRKLATQIQENGGLNDALNPEKAPENYRYWQSILDSEGVKPSLAVPQVATGALHRISDTVARCSLRISFFKKEGAISKLCHDCFKVQILPLDLMALMQVYFVFRGLKLPRDNSRKCMIELRENVAHPYKGYIFCESEEEAKYGLELVQQALRASKISNFLCAISHGCSEFGLKYPEFKYSEDGAHRSFAGPASWDQSESEFFATNPSPDLTWEGHNHDGITLRDMTVFRTWIDYAELIGDETCRKFRETPSSSMPEPFRTRARRQSKMRKAELAELRQRLESST